MNERMNPLVDTEPPPGPLQAVTQAGMGHGTRWELRLLPRPKAHLGGNSPELGGRRPNSRPGLRRRLGQCCPVFRPPFLYR